MAEIKIPIKIDGFKCVEDMAQAVLNYTCKGKTLKEWADSISEPKTNADRIRSMTDEELAEWISEYTDCLCGIHKPGCSKTKGTCVATWLDWLQKEADK